MKTELTQKGYQIYEKSADCARETECVMVKKGFDKFLAVKGAEANTFEGDWDGSVRICPLTTKNAQALRSLFSYTKPCRLPKNGISVGLGDRLGISTPGHIQAIGQTGIFPILAQQSIRELNLTGRTYPDVLAAATFGVFETGYRGGFAADGDHLKSLSEIEYALYSGFTLITLDCSEHISKEHLCADAETAEASYQKLPGDVRKHYESKYLGKDFPVVGAFTRSQLQRLVLTFHNAIRHVQTCWNHIQAANAEVDIELSIDETPMSTSPLAHFLIAQELTDQGITLWSCAPRFHGAFEKGIDYIGELDKFEKDFAQHQKIAEYFGYKLSVHSGSDKFSIYPIVSRYAKGNIHVKTAGTSWVETLRLIASANPDLFRKAYAQALKGFPDAKQYYVITTCLEDAPDLSGVPDSELSGYLDHIAARQILHITYGQLLAREWFAQGLLQTVRSAEKDYYACLEKHILRHISPFTAE